MVQDSPGAVNRLLHHLWLFRLSHTKRSAKNQAVVTKQTESNRIKSKTAASLDKVALGVELNGLAIVEHEKT